MTTSSRLERTGLGMVFSLAAVVIVSSGCSDEAEPNQVPEVARVEVEDGEVKLEEKFPLSPDDVGDVVMATGTVTGAPLSHGFFLLTEGNQVIFVESAAQVAPADHVRVVGPLGVAAIGTFDGWKRDALTGLQVADWDLLETWMIRASTVTEI